MPEELEFGERSNDAGLRLRKGGERRVHEQRRVVGRSSAGRRRAERRRAKLRTLVFAAAALATTHSVKTRPLTPGVSVSMADFRAVAPARAYDRFIAEAAEAYTLDPALIRAVMQAESAFDPTVVSQAGAQGLMQLMPALADEMGVVDAFDPRQNIMGGAKYLRSLLDRHQGNVRLTLASYNAGPTNVKRYRGVPPFRETLNYVKKITALIADARASSGDD